MGRRHGHNYTRSRFSDVERVTRCRWALHGAQGTNRISVNIKNSIKVQRGCRRGWYGVSFMHQSAVTPRMLNGGQKSSVAVSVVTAP